MIKRIVSHLSWSDFVVVRLLRHWAAAREMQDDAAPALLQSASELHESSEVAVALQSLFQLTEQCLGRTLQPECCCSPALSADEQAILALIAAAPERALPHSSGEIPHGLPGALCWAAVAARLALGGPPRPVAAAAPAHCPFERTAGGDLS